MKIYYASNTLKARSYMIALSEEGKRIDFGTFIAPLSCYKLFLWIRINSYVYDDTSK